MPRSIKPAPAVAAGFGTRLTEAREAAGMRKAHLAQASGMEDSYIAQMEKGRANPTLGALVRLARALGCDPADLVRGLHRL